jgi:transposase
MPGMEARPIATPFEIEVCRLRFVKGMKYREIAERLGRSLSAVKKAVWRVRRRSPGFAREFPPYAGTILLAD